MSKATDIILRPEVPWSYDLDAAPAGVDLLFTVRYKHQRRLSVAKGFASLELGHMRLYFTDPNCAPRETIAWSVIPRPAAPKLNGSA